MRNKILLLGVVFSINLVLILSCKKSNDSNPNPVPVPVLPDTLTTGWSKQVIAGETGMTDIFFNSSTTGYVAGQKIYKTTDGGVSWNPVYTSNSIINIFMTADSKAFFVSQLGLIYRTTDGGATFSGIPIAAPPDDIYFLDNNNGYCITVNGLFATTDAGATWSKVTTTGLPSIGTGYATLSCVNATTGWVVYQGAVYRSNGSFSNWQQANITGGSIVNFFSIYATSATNVYLANANGEIFRSTDGGANFLFVKKLDQYPGFTDLHFTSDLAGYASIGTHVYKTTDGGVNWSKVVSLGQGSLGELHFTDAGHGWVCGDNGTILIYKP